MGLKYEPSLDGLRAVACLAVVAVHAGVPGFQGGARGVDVFFVLSGYLITSMLAQGVGYGEFMRRRLRRLYPALLFMLAGVLTFSFLWPQVRTDALLAALYVTDITSARGAMPSPLAHTWSLSLETHFYLIWPLLLPWIIKSGRPVAVLACLWAAMVSFGSIPLLHMSGLVLGSAVALSRRLPGWIAYPAAACVVPLLMWDVPPALGIPVADLAAAFLISSLAGQSAVRSALALRPVAWLGLMSYGIYLWHFPVTWIVRAHFSWQATLAVSLLVSIPMAAVSYHIIEQPLRRPREGYISNSTETLAT